MTIKLFSLAKDFNIGINTLVEKLQEKGFSEVTANPNMRIGKKEFDCLTKEFGKEIPPETMEKLRKKLEGKPSSTQKNASEAIAPKPKIPAGRVKQSESPTDILTEVPQSLKPELKIVGDIKDIVPKVDPKVEAKIAAQEPPVPKEGSVPNGKSSEEEQHAFPKPTARPKSVTESEQATIAAAVHTKAVTPSHGDTSRKTVVNKTESKDKASPMSSTKPVSPRQALAKDTDSTGSTSSIAVPNAGMRKKEEIVTKRVEKGDRQTSPSAGSKDSVSKKERTTTDVSKKIPGSMTTDPSVKTSETSEPKSQPIKEQEIFRPGGKRPEMGVKVVGSINLDALNSSTRPSRKTKEERIKDRAAKGGANSGSGRKRISNQAVDIKAEGAKISDNRPTDKNRRGDRGSSSHPGANNQNRGRNTHTSSSSRRQPVRVEVKEEDVQKQVKETLARLTSKKTSLGKGAKYRKDKRDAASRAAHDAREQEDTEKRILKLTEFVTVSDLANMMDVAVNDVIATCMSIGLMVSINMRLDAETINLVTEEFGFESEFVSAELVESIQSEEEEDKEEDLQARPPIVTVMGHVDHGKTSLLDNIRNTNVIAGEAGGITQHIGAYNLKLQNGKHITFLDTPGHEAFTAMRARGAKITDIAIIIIAADDSVMPQTREAINHAAAAGVPMVFAINKVDKPGANPEKIREELAGMNYLVEDWGGKYQCQEISAKQGMGIANLLEKVLLEAEMLELKANPKRKAVGSIIESSLDKGRGYVATVLVQNGTLRMGDVVLAGTKQGRIKAMFNERNIRVKKAGPSEPVLILGLDEAPTAGDVFNVLETEQEARTIANKRKQLQREQNERTRQMLTLDILARRREIGNFQELNIIVKGDVDGSVQALGESLIKLSTEEIQVNVIHKGVGQVSESDVALATASSAVIVSFQVRPSVAARKMAEKEGIEIRTYSIIYDAIEDVKNAMEGMLSPEIREEVSGTLRVMQVFKITKVGTIAGCMVEEGKVRRNSKVRLIRDGIVVFSGKLGSLKRFKDDAKEVVAGLDCGLNLDGFNDIHESDIIEAFDEIEVKKTL